MTVKYSKNLVRRNANGLCYIYLPDDWVCTPNEEEERLLTISHPEEQRFFLAITVDEKTNNTDIAEEDLRSLLLSRTDLPMPLIKCYSEYCDKGFLTESVQTEPDGSRIRIRHWLLAKGNKMAYVTYSSKVGDDIFTYEFINDIVGSIELI